MIFEIDKTNYFSGCLPFVGEFMQMAYGNCVKQADQKTFDVWGREFESVVTGRGINFFRARFVCFKN